MLTYKPIVTWPGDLLEQKQRKASPFDSPWGKTLQLLQHELDELGATNVVFQVAVDENEIRLDGGLKAGVNRRHPGVIITFDSIHGPLSYYTDLYVEFAANVRAIALALEALRKVTRYAVNKQGSQYAGYKRLPAAGETTNGRKRILTDEEAATFMSGLLDNQITIDQVLNSSWLFETAYKQLAKGLHPDNKDTGDDDAFVDLQDAAALLKKRHGL